MSAYQVNDLLDERWGYESEAGITDFLLNPLGATVNAIGGLISPPPRPPLAPVQPAPAGAGVGSAVLNTPQGSATLRLPEPAVTQRDFVAAKGQLEEAINRNTARINTVTNDVQGLSKQVGTVVETTRKDVREALAKVRREQRTQASNSMMMSLVMLMGVQKQLKDHKHDQTTGAATVTGDDSMTMMLPFMMMQGGEGGGDDNSMMMMAMAIAMTK